MNAVFVAEARVKNVINSAALYKRACIDWSPEEGGHLCLLGSFLLSLTSIFLNPSLSNYISFLLLLPT